MRVSELSEGFGELDIVRQRIRELTRAETSFDFYAGTVSIFFEMTDGDGVIREGRAIYKPLPQGLQSPSDILRRKLSAAARSQRRGNPVDGLDAQMRACASIGPNAIRILTNPSDMRMVGLRWGDASFG